MKVDLTIIGAGPGGYEAAVKAAHSGLTVAVIEEHACGGTCLNVGCIPTKALCHSAEILEEAREAEKSGISFDTLHFDIQKAVARKNEIVGKLVSSVEALMKTPGITLINGRAQFKDAHTILVGEEEIQADNIIIATGSVTKFLPIEGAHCEGVVTSTEMLDLTQVPKRLCVIGGGVIGLEFASIFNAFGSEVTVVEFCKEVLPFFDQDIAKRLRTSLKKKGINFKVGAAATGIKPTQDGYTVAFEEKGKPAAIDCDLVLMAVGRGANIESLNFNDIGIEYTKKGVTVNEHFQTNIPNIYAVGDINGLMQLAHAATFQSFHALNHILGKKDDIRLDLVPAAVFTVPELAMVGKTEEQLKAEQVEYKAYKAFYRANGKAMTMDAEDGTVKLLADMEGHILGAHILGAHAADLIHEVTMLMRYNGTIEQLKDTIHAHPSLSEIVLNVQ